MKKMNMVRDGVAIEVVPCDHCEGYLCVDGIMSEHIKFRWLDRNEKFKTGGHYVKKN